MTRFLQHLSASFILLFVFCASVQSQTRPDNPRLYVYGIIVETPAIKLDEKTGEIVHGIKRGSGSGVVIAPGYMLTSAHLFSDAEQSMLDKMSISIVAIVNSKSPKVQAKVVKVDYENDLALLRVEGATCPCATLATVAPRIDDAVTVVGYPLGTNLGIQIASQGTFQGFNNGMLATTAFAAPGSSGGGLFIQRNGRFVLLGILDAVAAYQNAIVPGLSFSVSAIQVRKFVQDSPVELLITLEK